MSAASTSSVNSTNQSSCMECKVIGDCPACEPSQLCLLSSRTCDSCPQYYCASMDNTSFYNSFANSNTTEISSQYNTSNSNTTSDGQILPVNHSNRALMAGLAGGIASGITLLGVSILILVSWRYRLKARPKDKTYSIGSHNIDHADSVRLSFSDGDDFNSIHENQTRVFETSVITEDITERTNYYKKENLVEISSTRPTVSTWTMVETERMSTTHNPESTETLASTSLNNIWSSKLESNSDLNPWSKDNSTLTSNAASINQNTSGTVTRSSSANSKRSNMIPIAYLPEILTRQPVLDFGSPSEYQDQSWPIISQEFTTHTMPFRTAARSLHDSQYSEDITDNNIPGLDLSELMIEEFNRSKTISKFIINDVGNQAFISDFDAGHSPGYYDEFDETDDDQVDEADPDLDNYEPPLHDFNDDEIVEYGIEVDLLIESMGAEDFLEDKEYET
ncbi:hypothetical protein NADFUDRAFT_46984 [Nadsonia fulvescens var. elongata DSM 6958]|uniref:Membrane anchor Opy2 N-terminal domain-containing protein n=1 Tax=Nadsonia fulvescens var. elongata DSM 6958 TaxID=857566 RepID=A0A1E3PIM4_9ASCO|nr:hypothetical protein NADFUDRAFT_46984 [Nadsonia fulvescens var. elongata DSM 6958]